jgi:DNA-binding CsgD family transcriptional regulator
MSLDGKYAKWVLLGFSAIAFVLLLALEVVTETGTMSLADLAVDATHILLTIAASVGAVLLFQRTQKQQKENMALHRDLGIARADGDHWRSKLQSHINGLRAGLDSQFMGWALTGAEREVGLLILKGLNHKEIGTVRDTSEATVRQQAQSIYRKAGLPGKTAFCAYFLEDLLLPEEMLNNAKTQPSTASQKSA